MVLLLMPIASKRWLIKRQPRWQRPYRQQRRRSCSSGCVADSEHNEDTFHRAVGPVLFTAQLFGLMPVNNILSPHVRDLYFRWCHPKVLFSLTITAATTFEFGLVIWEDFFTGHKFQVGDSAFLIFTGSILIGQYQLLRLARVWPALLRLWQRCEAVFLQYPYTRIHKARRRVSTLSMRWRLRLVCFSVLFFALVEHCLYLASTFYGINSYIEQCALNVTTFDGYVERAFRSERGHFLIVLPYSLWIVLPLECLNVAMTFVWTFINVFVMAVSVGLARRFEQIAERMEAVCGRQMPNTFWIEMRSNYVVLVELLQRVDAEVSGLVLLSCANNLFFICYQLFNSFNDIPNAINAVYFWLSLAFIMSRTLAMLFCAASVNDASRRPIAVLRNVPCSAWNVEVQRFTAQCTTGDVVALSGKRFFYLTRSLILAMAGTVATYELVLLDELKGAPAPVPKAC